MHNTSSSIQFKLFKYFAFRQRVYHINQKLTNRTIKKKQQWQKLKHKISYIQNLQIIHLAAYASRPVPARRRVADVCVVRSCPSLVRLFALAPMAFDRRRQRTPPAHVTAPSERTAAAL
jgi:hypothetical protein